MITQHVSVANLQNTDNLTLLKSNTMDPNDTKIWESVYDEEYDGLQNLLTWKPISESECQKIKHVVGNALLTMAISAIKYEENGAPKRAKWYIVALGNLDPHDWSTKGCFVPVLSMLELCFLVSLAI